MQTRIISPDDLREKGIPYSRSQIWRRIKERTFPAPIRLGGNRIGWIEAELDAWIAERMAERDSVQPAGAT